MRGSADAMISITPVDDIILVECSNQRNGPPFPSIALKPVPLPDGGCTLRLGKDVLPGTELSTTQAKVFSVLRDTFTADGATKSEWQRACQDIPERTFHRAAKMLLERKFTDLWSPSRANARPGNGRFRNSDGVGTSRCKPRWNEMERSLKAYWRLGGVVRNGQDIRRMEKVFAAGSERARGIVRIGA